MPSLKRRAPPSGGEPPLVVAHRGVHREAPQNTLRSLTLAIEMGVPMVEFDVRRTGDGVLVLHHAPGIRGIPLRRLTYANLVERYPPEDPPPKLAEVIAACAGRVRLDLDLKEAGYEAEVIDLVRGRYDPREFVVTSFFDSILVAAKAHAPDVSTGLIVASRRSDTRGQGPVIFPLARATSCGADLIVPHRLLATSGLIDRAIERGLGVMVWTVNGRRRLTRFLGDERITGVITDTPEIALEVCRQPDSAGN